MRFYLDNDVDVRCRKVLVQAGHVCWTAWEAGLAGAPDEVHAIYAQDRGAVLITHDVAFTGRQKRRTVGRHVFLGCQQPDGPGLLARWLDSVVLNAPAFADVVIELTPRRFTVIPGRWE